MITFFAKKWFDKMEKKDDVLQSAIENTTSTLNKKIEQGNKEIQEKIQKNDEKVNERIDKLEEKTVKMNFYAGTQCGFKTNDSGGGSLGAGFIVLN